MRELKELNWYKGTLNLGAAGFLGDEFDIDAVQRGDKRSKTLPLRDGSARKHIYFSVLKDDIQHRVLIASTVKFSDIYCVKALTGNLAASIIDVDRDERGQQIEAQEPYRTLVNMRAQHIIYTLSTPQDNFIIGGNE